MKIGKLLAILVVVGAIGAGFFLMKSSQTFVPAKKYDVTLLDNLPQGTKGFISFDLTSSSYKNYVSNPSFKRYVTEYNKIFKSPLFKGTELYFGFLERLGLWPKSDVDFSPPISNLTWFLVFDSTGPQVGLYSSLATQKSNASFLTEITNFLKANGMSVNDVSVSEGKSISFEVFADPAPASADINLATNPLEIYRSIFGKRTLYMAENSGKFMFATAKPLLDEILVSSPNKPKAKLLVSANFKEAQAKLDSSSQDMGIVYFDLAETISSVEALPSAVELADNMNEVPFSYFAGVYGGVANLNGKMILRASLKTDLQRKIFAALEGLPTYTALDNLPKSAAFAFSVPGALAKKVLGIVETMGATPIPPDVKQKLELIASTEEVAIGVQPAKLEGGWPEGLLVVEGGETDKMIQAIKEIVGQAFPAAGGSAPWQNLDVEGLKTEFILTPFSVGFYIAKSDNKFFFSTSQEGIKSFATMLKQGDSASVSLSSESKKIISESNGPWFYSNYETFADLMLGLQKSMAMFLPAEQQEELKTFDAMRYLGKVAFGASYSNNTLEIPFLQEFPVTKN